MPRFADGCINLQEVIRRFAEQAVNAIMDAEADQLCKAPGNSRNGYRERSLKTCVGELRLRVPKLRSGSFFPEDVIERYQRVDRALAAAVAEMYAGGTSTRKVQRVAEKMGVPRLSKDQVSAICASLDAEPDALAYLDLPASHWKRLRANNVQERANREIKRRSRVAQVFSFAVWIACRGGHIRARRRLGRLAALLRAQDVQAFGDWRARREER